MRYPVWIWCALWCVSFAMAQVPDNWYEQAHEKLRRSHVKESELFTKELAPPDEDRGISVPPDDSSWAYAGSDRAAAKTRSAKVVNAYKSVGPLTLPAFYKLVKALNSKVPDKAPLDAMPGIEDVKVTVKAYMIAIRFERGEDHDLHCQIAATPSGNDPQLIVEVPAAPDFIAARKVLWDLVRADAAPRAGSDTYVMKKPVLISVTGALLLDAHHRPKGATDLDVDNGGRGIPVGGKNRVQGLWEIHPVTSVAVVKG